MQTKFIFKGFEPEDSLVIKANHALDRILDQAPFDSTAVALLEKVDDAFRCAVDIYSKHGPFISSGDGSTAEEALAHFEKKILRNLQGWRERRFSKVRNKKTPHFGVSVA